MSKQSNLKNFLTSFYFVWFNSFRLSRSKDEKAIKGADFVKEFGNATLGKVRAVWGDNFPPIHELRSRMNLVNRPDDNGIATYELMLPVFVGYHRNEVMVQFTFKANSEELNALLEKI